MPHVPLSPDQYYNNELNMKTFSVNTRVFYFVYEVSTIEIIGTNLKYFPRIFETSGLNKNKCCVDETKTNCIPKGCAFSLPTF